MTLRSLWQMATGRRESRRALALDVWRLANAGKFDVDTYLRTGQIAEYAHHELPDNPELHAAIAAEMAKAEKQKKEVEKRKGDVKPG